MAIDKIADLLTRIRNAQRAGHPTATIPASVTKESILKVLQQEGYVASYEKFKDANDKPALKVYLRYLENKAPVIKEINRISKSGKRVYVNSEQIPSFKGGLGVLVVSTSKGMMSGTEAKKQGVGGEVICNVF